MEHKRWTPKEVRDLRRAIRTVGRAQAILDIAAQTGRTTVAVGVKITKLNRLSRAANPVKPRVRRIFERKHPIVELLEKKLNDNSTVSFPNGDILIKL